ncbi:hypothetical protein NC651_032045 [Populus alba x Populus x berolinensis]|nr:hypothetical protein NC651_032045 [Populus alba x Populus x berolinensis]
MKTLYDIKLIVYSNFDVLKVGLYQRQGNGLTSSVIHKKWYATMKNRIHALFFSSLGYLYLFSQYNIPLPRSLTWNPAEPEVFCSATNGILGSRSASDFTREGGSVRGEGGGAVGLGLGLTILRDGVGPGTRAALVVTALVAGEFGTEDVTVAGLGAGELGAEDVVDAGLVEGEVETEADGAGVEAGEVGTEDEVRDGLRIGEGGSEKVVGLEVGTGEVGTEDEGAGALGAGDVGNDATPPAALTAGDVGTEAIPAAGGTGSRGGAATGGGTVAAEGGGEGVGS